MRIPITHHVPHPLTEVLAWHDRPGAIVRLTPPGLATMDDPAAGGMEAGRVVGTRLGPPLLPDLLRPHWLLRHRESDPEAGRFVDQQVKGPWRTWRHEHTFRADGDSTAVHDDLYLELPRHLERLEPLAESQVRGVFAFRDRQLQGDLAFHARFADAPRRTVAVAGASGLIGTQLAALLETGGHTVLRMVRRPDADDGEISWDPQQGLLDPADLEGVDVVVNLGGRSLATRWTSGAMAEMRSSRIEGTTLIARTLAGMDDGPDALVQASAIGLYGPRRPGERLTESDPGGDGFLAELVRDWEGAAQPAAAAGLRVAAVRTGLVLSDGGGPLVPQLPLFLLGVGGRLTAADAMTSWISLDDEVRAVAEAVLSADVSGPVNAVAPEPVTSQEFARTLGRVLRRPALVPVPGVGPRLLLGAQAAEEMIRTDQDVSADRLRSTGFEHAHPTLESALRHVLRR